MQDKTTPKYLELIDWIREQIEEKELQPGRSCTQKIP